MIDELKEIIEYAFYNLDISYLVNHGLKRYNYNGKSVVSSYMQTDKKCYDRVSEVLDCISNRVNDKESDIENMKKVVMTRLLR